MCEESPRRLSHPIKGHLRSTLPQRVYVMSHLQMSHSPVHDVNEDMRHQDQHHDDPCHYKCERQILCTES